MNDEVISLSKCTTLHQNITKITNNFISIDDVAAHSRKFLLRSHRNYQGNNDTQTVLISLLENMSIRWYTTLNLIHFVFLIIRKKKEVKTKNVTSDASKWIIHNNIFFIPGTLIVLHIVKLSTFYHRILVVVFYLPPSLLLCILHNRWKINTIEH